MQYAALAVPNFSTIVPSSGNTRAQYFRALHLLQ